MLVSYTFDVKDLHENSYGFSLLLGMEVTESLLIKTKCSDEITAQWQKWHKHVLLWESATSFSLILLANRVLIIQMQAWALA